jgi:hypothetical protein
MIETIEMTEQSDQWTREIEDLSNENSAKILSVVLGITKGEAADKLIEVTAKRAKGFGPESSSGFQQFLSMANVLNTEMYTTSLVSTYRTGISSGVQFTDKFPTVNQWLNANPSAFGILRAGNHYVYVGMGIILSTSVPPFGHVKVTHMILLGD